MDPGLAILSNRAAILTPSPIRSPFDHVAQMDADTKLDAALWRKTSVALDHAVLELDGAAYRVNHATKFDDAAVARALHHPPVMQGDGGVDQIAAERSQAGERLLLVGAGQLAVSDYIRRKNGCEFPGLRHGSPLITR
jgi:hypothetical protein